MHCLTETRRPSTRTTHSHCEPCGIVAAKTYFQSSKPLTAYTVAMASEMAPCLYASEGCRYMYRKDDANSKHNVGSHISRYHRATTTISYNGQQRVLVRDETSRKFMCPCGRYSSQDVSAFRRHVNGMHKHASAQDGPPQLERTPVDFVISSSPGSPISDFTPPPPGRAAAAGSSIHHERAQADGARPFAGLVDLAALEAASANVKKGTRAVRMSDALRLALSKKKARVVSPARSVQPKHRTTAQKDTVKVVSRSDPRDVLTHSGGPSAQKLSASARTSAARGTVVADRSTSQESDCDERKMNTGSSMAPPKRPGSVTSLSARHSASVAADTRKSTKRKQPAIHSQSKVSTKKVRIASPPPSPPPLHRTTAQNGFVVVPRSGPLDVLSDAEDPPTHSRKMQKLSASARASAARGITIRERSWSQEPGLWDEWKTNPHRSQEDGHSDSASFPPGCPSPAKVTTANKIAKRKQTDVLLTSKKKARAASPGPSGQLKPKPRTIAQNDLVKIIYDSDVDDVLDDSEDQPGQAQEAPARGRATASRGITIRERSWSQEPGFWDEWKTNPYAAGMSTAPIHFTISQTKTQKPSKGKRAAKSSVAKGAGAGAPSTSASKSRLAKSPGHGITWRERSDSEELAFCDEWKTSSYADGFRERRATAQNDMVELVARSDSNRLTERESLPTQSQKLSKGKAVAKSAVRRSITIQEQVNVKGSKVVGSQKTKQSDKIPQDMSEKAAVKMAPAPAPKHRAPAPIVIIPDRASSDGLADPESLTQTYRATTPTLIMSDAASSDRLAGPESLTRTVPKRCTKCRAVMPLSGRFVTCADCRQKAREKKRSKAKLMAQQATGASASAAGGSAVPAERKVTVEIQEESVEREWEDVAGRAEYQTQDELVDALRRAVHNCSESGELLDFHGSFAQVAPERKTLGTGVLQRIVQNAGVQIGNFRSGKTGAAGGVLAIFPCRCCDMAGWGV
ncbi:hypothetical protein OBBRIDRAFT_825052, partial [Obba rivulosa]